MKTLILAIAILLLRTVAVQAQSANAVDSPGVDSPGVRKQQFNLENGLAIQGYDPVAYFTRNKAVKGSAANAFAYKNVTYRFASATNLKTFQENPARYGPQYGGWCAYALGATGEKVEIDPETFKVKDGKLFLFYHSFINNTLPKWNKDENNLHRKADASWKKFVQS